MPKIKHCVKLFYSLVSGAKAEPSTESGGYAPEGGFCIRKIFPPSPISGLANAL